MEIHRIKLRLKGTRKEAEHLFDNYPIKSCNVMLKTNSKSYRYHPEFEALYGKNINHIFTWETVVNIKEIYVKEIKQFEEIKQLKEFLDSINKEIRKNENNNNN